VRSEEQNKDFRAFCPALYQRFEGDQDKKTPSLDEALRSLYVLFIHCARRQEHVNPDWLREFAGDKPPRNPYRTPEEVRHALHTHPIYRWLRRELKGIMEHMPAELMKEFRLVFELLDHLVVASAKVQEPEGRPDKRRSSAKRRIDDLLSDIEDGTVTLPRAERALLRSLLGKASRALRKQQPKSIRDPILQSLARTFVLFDITAGNASLLTEAAHFLGIECNPSTALRYTKRAERVWSGRSSEVKLDFHLLEVLRDDYRKQKRAIAH
jgi:hypothetical protein